MADREQIWKIVADFSSLVNQSRRASRALNQLDDSRRKASYSAEKPITNDKDVENLDRLNESLRETVKLRRADNSAATKHTKSLMASSAAIARNSKDIDNSTRSIESHTASLHRNADAIRGQASASAGLSKSMGNTSRANTRAIRDNDMLGRSVTRTTARINNMARQTSFLTKALDSNFPSSRSFAFFMKMIPLTAVTSALNVLIPQVNALGGALVGLTATITPLVGVFGALPTMLTAVGGAIGGLVAGLGGVISTMSAYKALQDAQAKSNKELTASERATARSRQRSLRSTARSIEDARRAQVRAAEDIIDAEERVREVVEENADRIIRAQKAIADSQKDLIQAQEDVNQARKDAADALDDYRLRLRGAALDEQSATVALQKARATLAATMADPGASALERRSASLAVQEAQLRLEEVESANADLSKEAEKAAKKGVENSDLVVDAKEREADAEYQVVEAQKDLQDAYKTNARATKDAARGVEDARQSYADAGERIVELQESMEDLQLTIQETADGTGDAATQMAAYKAALDKLSPTAKLVVGELINIQDAWQDTAYRAQEAMSPGLLRFLEDLQQDLLPMIGDFLVDMAEGAGDFFSELGDLLTTEESLDQLMTIFEDGKDFMSAMGDATLNLTTLFLGLGQAASDSGLTDWIGEVIKSWTGGWADNVDTPEGIENTAEAMEYTMHTAELWGDAISSTFGFLRGFLENFRPLGEWMLENITETMDEWTAWMDTPDGQEKFKGWIELAKINLSGISDFIGTLVDQGPKLFGTWDEATGESTKGFEKFWTALNGDEEGNGGFINALGDLMGIVDADMISALLGMGEGIAGILQALGEAGGMDVVVGIFETFATVLKDVADVLKNNPGLAEAISYLMVGLAGKSIVTGVSGAIGATPMVSAFGRAAGKGYTKGTAGRGGAVAREYFGWGAFNKDITTPSGQAAYVSQQAGRAARPSIRQRVGGVASRLNPFSRTSPGVPKGTTGLALGGPAVAASFVNPLRGGAAAQRQAIASGTNLTPKRRLGFRRDTNMDSPRSNPYPLAAGRPTRATSSAAPAGLTEPRPTIRQRVTGAVRNRFPGKSTTPAPVLNAREAQAANINKQQNKRKPLFGGGKAKGQRGRATGGKAGAILGIASLVGVGMTMFGGGEANAAERGGAGGGGGDAVGGAAGSAEAKASGVTSVIDTVKEAIGGLVESLGGFETILFTIIPMLTMLGPVFGMLGKAIGGIWKIAGPVFKFLGGGFLKIAKVVGIAMKIIGAAISANPWMLLIVALVAIVILVVKNWDKIKEAVGKAIEWVGNLLSKWGEGITKWWDGVWSGIKKLAEDIWDGIKKAIEWYIGTWVAIFHAIIDPLAEWWDGLWTGIKDLASDIWDGIKDLIQRSVDGWVAIFHKVIDPLADWWSDFWDDIKSVASNIWEGISEGISGLVDGVKDIWDGIEQIFKDPIGVVIGFINDNLGGILNKVADFLGFGTPFPIEGFDPYDKGGWTGPGGRLQPAGIVHADEFVVKKSSRQKIERRNPGALDYMNKHGRMPGYDTGGRVLPVSGNESGNYKGHSGIDYAVPIGTPVYAPDQGRIDYTGSRRGYGTAIFQDFYDGMRGVYGHLSRVVVQAGDVIKAGQLIGYSGNTGNSTGPHLHFEVTRGSFDRAENRETTREWLGGSAYESTSWWDSAKDWFSGLTQPLKFIKDKFLGTSKFGYELVSGLGSMLIEKGKEFARQAFFGSPTDNEVVNIGWTSQQGYANQIASIAYNRGFGYRGALLGIMAAMQESGLRNLNGGDRDSAGLFQQRPSQGWGTYKQITTPSYAIGKFFDAMSKMRAWSYGPEWQDIQNIQRSAYPQAYQKHKGAATEYLRQYLASSRGTTNMFDGGGWTGPGSKYRPAGIVHADEYVINKGSRRRLERIAPGMLDYMNANGTLPGYASGGAVKNPRLPSYLQSKKVYLSYMQRAQDFYGSGKIPSELHDQVKILSYLLNREGLLASKYIDHIWGYREKVAWKGYQKKNGSTQTGIVEDALLSKLLKKYGITYDSTTPWVSGISQPSRLDVISGTLSANNKQLAEYMGYLGKIRSWGFTNVFDTLKDLGPNGIPEEYQDTVNPMTGMEMAKSFSNSITAARKYEEALREAKRLDGSGNALESKMGEMVDLLTWGFDGPYGLQSAAKELGISVDTAAMLYKKIVSTGAMKDVSADRTSRIRSDVVDFDNLFKFATGGIVPGTGNRDSVLSLLTPGEMVLPTDVVQAMFGSNRPSITPFLNLASRTSNRTDTNGVGSGNHYEFNTNVYNPVAEESSVSVQKRVNSVAKLGLLGGRR